MLPSAPRSLGNVYDRPTEKGWEDAELFKVGHTANGTVWWATWRWNGWVA